MLAMLSEPMCQSPVVWLSVLHVAIQLSSPTSDNSLNSYNPIVVARLFQW